MKVTGALLLSIAGILAAFLTFIGGFLSLPYMLGVAGGIMLVGNMLCFGAEITKQINESNKRVESFPIWLRAQQKRKDNRV